jgi:Tfp pilus assembly protein PilF
VTTQLVLLLDPANHDALLGLAQEQSKEKRFTDVVDLLGPHVEDASVSADLLQLLMQAYTGLGRTADAEKISAQLRASQRRR